MRRIIFAIGATLSGIVLLFSWPTSTNQPVTSAGGTTGGSTGSGGSAVGTGGTTSGAVTTATYDGAAASTRYGDVQVEITVTADVVADATATPTGTSLRVHHPSRDYGWGARRRAVRILEATVRRLRAAGVPVSIGPWQSGLAPRG